MQEVLASNNNHLTDDKLQQKVRNHVDLTLIRLAVVATIGIRIRAHASLP